MKNTSSLIYFQFTIPLLIALCVFLTPLFTYAETYYRCIDKNGAETITNIFVSKESCKPIGSFEEMSDQEWGHVKKAREIHEVKRSVEYEKRKEAEKKAAAEAAVEAAKEKRLRDLEERAARAEAAAAAAAYSAGYAAEQAAAARQRRR